MSDEERTAAEMLEYMGTDPARWAAEFVHRRKARDFDEDAMISWFGSAIEAGRTAGRRAVCAHLRIASLSDDLSYCPTCGKLFEGLVAGPTVPAQVTVTDDEVIVEGVAAMTGIGVVAGDRRTIIRHCTIRGGDT